MLIYSNTVKVKSNSLPDSIVYLNIFSYNEIFELLNKAGEFLGVPSLSPRWIEFICTCYSKDQGKCQKTCRHPK